MEDLVKLYLPEAVAIIFVINVANAGGLRREMLENVIEYTRQVSLDKQRESFSKCALFVCNKWDQVPSEETDEVKNTIVRKLTECLPSLDPESQIIYMSAKDASKEEFTELMNGIESMVLKTIEARLQIQWRSLYHLLSRIVSQTNTFIRNSRNDSFKPLHRMSVNLRDEMAVFGIKEAPIMDISCDDLEWQENAVIGIGAFASVYRGTLKIEDGVQPLKVALKVWKEELNEATASGFLSETETLRKLNHQFIVKFYGAALHKEGDRLRTILVMELCTENLRSHIFQHKSKVPGQSSTPTAARNVIGWAKDIADALKYIHRQGIVHRDLKLENILLSLGNVAKVADVGVSKEAKAITGTMTGTPMYLAPEVMKSCIYDYKADVYSFGIMLWEMWYGKRAHLDLVGDVKEFYDKVLEGARPAHVEGSKKPPIGLRDLMQDCWDKKPDNRPDATKCHKKLTQLYQDAVAPY